MRRRPHVVSRAALSVPLAMVISAGLLVAAGAASLPALAADQVQQASAAPGAPAKEAPPWNPTWDRPVLDFLRSPAMLLLTPEEALEYDRLTDNLQRRIFMDRFWSRVGVGCGSAQNPLREEFLRRAAEAQQKFPDEGVPGWITDRGRFYVLLGPPEKSVTEGTGPVQRLVWTWPTGAAGRPGTVAFVRERLRWVFVGADAAAGTTAQPVNATIAGLAASYRQQECQLTPEQRAAAAALAWRKTLYDLAGQVLAGQTVTIPQPLVPSWYFFPAEGDATLVLLTVPLERPLESGQRFVALVRRDTAGGDVREEDAVYSFGTDDFPFEIRPTGDGYVAQAVRALPPGRYAVALGLANKDGEAVPRHAAEQVIVRLGRDTLRLASVIMAEQLKPIDGGKPDEVRPFRIAGYEIVPRASRVAQNGETLTFFGVVLGVGPDAIDLKVRYQLQFQQPGKGWVPVGQFENVLTQAVLAQDLQMHPKLPPGEYKLVIAVTDNKTGGALTQEVPFRLRPKA